MKQQTLLISLLALMLVITGCSTTAPTNTYTDPFIGGNIGLNLYLQNGAPPPFVYDGGRNPFPVSVVTENVGEADIGPGTDNPYMTVRLEGILPSSFGVTDADLHKVIGEKMEGAKKMVDGTKRAGIPQTFVFENLNYGGKLEGNDQVTIRSTVCYDYSNLATTKICMKSDILENVQDSTLCSLTGERMVFNSGGPIHVTKAVQNPLGPNKIQVTFDISHLGTGEFYGRDPSEDCNPSVRNSNKYIVDLNVSVQDPNSKVSCYRLNNGGASGRVTLYAGAPVSISCNVEHIGGNISVYTDVLKIQTSYRYGQFIEQAVGIQSTPN